MKIALTGGTGFIGRHLQKRLLQESHSVTLLTRRPRTGLDPGVGLAIWAGESGEPPLESLAGVDAVIHLAGEPVAQRWTPEAKRRIRASRVDATRNLVSALAAVSTKPSVLISASAIGYYGDRGDEILTEGSPAGTGWLAEVTKDWEEAAKAAEGVGIRVVMLRTGVVLGRDGGALSRMLPPFRLGLGGRMGSGEQWMSWVHVEDVIGLILFALRQTALRGPVNTTTPNPLRNAGFTEQLAEVLHRPALFPAPTFAIKAVFGEMASVVLGGQRVLPEGALNAGYEFLFPHLSTALRDLLAK